MDRCSNGDGTYSGVKMLAKLSGLPEAELRWTWTRMRELMFFGWSMEAAKDQVALESQSKPWLSHIPRII